MPPKYPPKRPSSSGRVPSAARQPARQQRLANRAAGRVPARSGTRGSSGNGLGSLLVWSAVFGIVAIVIVGVAIVISQSQSNTTGAPVAPGATTPINILSSGRTLGNANAPVTIDVYGDFRCSACFVFTTNGTEKSLVDNYVATSKAKLVWHDYLTIDAGDGATASRDAANAAWCAADQGKFWVMHDWLYANQSPTENASAFTMPRLSDIGKAAGLDMSKYQTCLDQGTHDAAIAAEQTAKPAQVTATPSILVNGRYVAGANANSWPTYDLIKAAIDAALASPTPSGSAGAASS
jgi:protein-disulfide isomerase